MIYVALVGGLKKRVSLQHNAAKRAETASGRVAGAVLFVAVFLLSAVALAAVAVAAPIMLALSAIAGLIANKKSASGWRSAGA